MSVKYRFRPALLGVLFVALAAAVPARGQVSVVNMIPQELSGETNQDSEPNLAVNPANPLQIAGSAFTPDPFGQSEAPIFASSDGGKTWLLNNIVPSDSGAATGDITIRFSTKGSRFYAGILRRPG